MASPSCIAADPFPRESLVAAKTVLSVSLTRARRLTALASIPRYLLSRSDDARLKSVTPKADESAFRSTYLL